MSVSHKNAVSKGQRKILSRSIYIPDNIWRALRVHLVSTPGSGSANQYLIRALWKQMKEDGIDVPGVSA